MKDHKPVLSVTHKNSNFERCPATCHVPCAFYYVRSNIHHTLFLTKNSKYLKISQKYLEISQKYLALPALPRSLSNGYIFAPKYILWDLSRKCLQPKQCIFTTTIQVPTFDYDYDAIVPSNHVFLQ